MTSLADMIHWSSTTRGVDEAGSYPLQQVTYLGKTANVTPWWPYGYDASVPVNHIGLTLAVLANSDSKVALFGSPGQGPKKASGEVAWFHPPTGSKIHFLANGDILLETETQVTVTAPKMTISGDVTIAGDLTVDGSTALSATVTSNGKDISDTHTHLGSPTAPLGVVSPTGVPI